MLHLKEGGGGGGGGGGGSLKFGVRDTFLKIVSLLENYRSEWGKVSIFGKLSVLDFKNTKIITISATAKSYSGLSPESVATHVLLLETYLLPHLLK